MTTVVASPSPANFTLLCVGLLGAYFAFWLATRAAIAERDAQSDTTPSHEDLARRQAEIDRPAKTWRLR